MSDTDGFIEEVTEEVRRDASQYNAQRVETFSRREDCRCQT